MLVGEAAGELCKMVLSPLCRSLRYAGRRETCTRMQPAAGLSVATRLSVCLSMLCTCTQCLPVFGVTGKSE